MITFGTVPDHLSVVEEHDDPEIWWEPFPPDPENWWEDWNVPCLN